MKIIVIAAAAPLILLGGCVTTATAEQRTACVEMESRMGNDPTHSHAESKGQPRSSMNLSHDQCRKILAQSN